MSYERHGDTYLFSAFDFDGSGTIGLVGPKGKAGTLIDYGLQNCSETFAGTVLGMVEVGDGTTANKFGTNFTPTGLASGGAKTVCSTYDIIADAASYAALMVLPTIPANTTVTLTLTAATGSSAGIAQPYVKIRWDD